MLYPELTRWMIYGNGIVNRPGFEQVGMVLLLLTAHIGATFSAVSLESVPCSPTSFAILHMGVPDFWGTPQNNDFPFGFPAKPTKKGVPSTKDTPIYVQYHCPALGAWHGDHLIA